MPDQLQLRGGTTTEHNSFTGAAREVTVDTTKKTLVVHDGSQAGGTPLMKESGATAASSVQIGTGGVERFKITSSEVVFNETSTDTDFRIEGNGDANLFKIDAGNDRIGIGISSPVSKLHIDSATNYVDIALRNTTSGSTGTDGADIFFNNNLELGLWNREAGSIRFATSSAERLRIDSSGNVGIGTTSPRDKLEIKGANGGYSFRVNAEAQFVKLLSSDNTGGQQGGFRFATDNAATEVERMRIDSAGNVGIGNTSPQGQLHIGAASQSNHEAMIILNNGGATGQEAGIEWRYETGTTPRAKIHVNSSDQILRFSTADNECMRIDSSGNLGIGTTTPTQRLTVLGGSTDSAIAIFTGNDLNRGLKVSTATENSQTDMLVEFEAHGQHSSQYEGEISLKTGGAHRLRVDKAGNVGIGTTSPTDLFHIQGNSSGAIVAKIENAYNSDDDRFAILEIKSGICDIRFHDEADNLSGAITYDSGTNSMQFRTNGYSGAERMRIDSSGHLSVNSTGAGSVFNVKDTITGVQPVDDTQTITLQTGATSGAANTGTGIMFLNHNGQSGNAGGTFGGTISCLKENATVGNTANYLRFATRAAGGSITESMRIDSVGGLRLNTTGVNSDNELFSITEAGTTHNIGGFRINNASNDKIMINMINVANSGDRKFFSFKRTGSVTEIGSINTTASATAFNTSSDYRLKENEVLISDGITRLKTLKPYRFNFKIEPDKTVDGFFAHEVSSAVPEAITGVKDAVETTYYINGDTIPDGKAVGDVKEENVILPQSLDYSKFTPLLTAALQEAIAKIEVLETKVAALEAA